MKRNISILLSLCFIFCAGAKAQFVSQEIALKIAEGFFESYLPSSKLTAQALGNREQPTMYVFSTHNHWVLIAADKRVQPILAYSDDIEGVFPSEEAMPPAMLDLLEWYSEQIENLRKDDLIKESHPQWGNFVGSHFLYKYMNFSYPYISLTPTGNLNSGAYTPSIEFSSTYPEYLEFNPLEDWYNPGILAKIHEDSHCSITNIYNALNPDVYSLEELSSSLQNQGITTNIINNAYTTYNFWYE